jgi:site-specific DNA recombinase
MRAAIYCRISKDAQEQGAGVRRQERECRELVERRGWEVGEVFTDNDVSATSGRRRPEFERMKDALREGRFDSIVAWHQDRLWRVMGQDTLDIMDLARDRHLPIACVASPDIDLTSPDGEMVATILTATATAEVRRASVRQKARWRQRKRDGKLVNLGRRPFGLKRRGETMVEVPKEAKALRTAARKLIEGKSLYAVAREMTVPPPYAKRWHPDKLKRALMGNHLVRYGIFDKKMHQLIVARLTTDPKNKRNGPGAPRRRYALSGLVVCGLCGEKMGAGSGSYICQACGKVGVLTKYADAVVWGGIGEHLPPEEEPAPLAARDDDVEVLDALTKVEDRLTALVENVELSESVLARRAKVLEAKRDDLMTTLGKPRQQFPEGWFTKLYDGVEQGLPTDDDGKAYLATIVERVVVKPAPKPGSKKFDPSRIEVVWR